MTRPVKRKQPFTLKRWTENRALKATVGRFDRIDALVRDIEAIWSDEDQYIVSETERLRQRLETAKYNFVCAAQARAEEREAA